MEVAIPELPSEVLAPGEKTTPSRYSFTHGLSSDCWDALKEIKFLPVEPNGYNHVFEDGRVDGGFSDMCWFNVVKASEVTSYKNFNLSFTVNHTFSPQLLDMLSIQNQVETMRLKLNYRAWKSTISVGNSAVKKMEMERRINAESDTYVAGLVFETVFKAMKINSSLLQLESLSQHVLNAADKTTEWITYYNKLLKQSSEDSIKMRMKEIKFIRRSVLSAHEQLHLALQSDSNSKEKLQVMKQKLASKAFIWCATSTKHYAVKPESVFATFDWEEKWAKKKK